MTARSEAGREPTTDADYGGPRRRRARHALGVGWCAVLLGVLVACSSTEDPHWAPVADSGERVLALVADGSDLVVGREKVTATGQFVLDVQQGGNSRRVPIRSSPDGYGYQAQLHSVSARDGALVVLGGVRAGAHGNVRWSVWRGSLDGISEQPQLFDTFGGYGAGDLVGAAVTTAGPMIIGSWSNPTGLGMEVTSWIPQGQKWVRSTDPVVAAATATTLPTAAAVTSTDAEYVVAGSITHLLPKLWEEPVVWRADRPRGPWRQISLPLPAETASARALALSCSVDHCAVVGRAGRDTYHWRLELNDHRVGPSGRPTRALDGLDEPGRAAPVLVAATGSSDVVTATAAGTTRTAIVEGSHVTVVESVPGAAVAIAAPSSGQVELVTEAQGRSSRWSLVAPGGH